MMLIDKVMMLLPHIADRCGDAYRWLGGSYDPDAWDPDTLKLSFSSDQESGVREKIVDFYREPFDFYYLCENGSI